MHFLWVYWHNKPSNCAGDPKISFHNKYKIVALSIRSIQTSIPLSSHIDSMYFLWLNIPTCLIPKIIWQSHRFLFEFQFPHLQCQYLHFYRIEFLSIIVFMSLTKLQMQSSLCLSSSDHTLA